MPPAIPDKINCTTPAELERELREIRAVLALPETEDNWEKLARELQRYASIVRGGAAKVEPEFGKALKELSRAITAAMCSERTRLSGTACDLLATIAPRMGDKFDAVLPLFFPEVLKLCSRTNKLFIARAQKTLAVIITHTKLAGVFPFLREAVKDKSHTLRISAIEMTLQCMKEYEARILRAKVDDIESILRSTATDPNPEARKLSKQLFELYKKQFPDRVEDFSDPLTPITKRYLDIAPRDKSAAASKPAQSKSNKGPAPSTKPRPDFSASTSAAPHEPGPSRPAHGRSASTTVLGQPVRPKLVASQTERPAKTEPAVSLAKSVSAAIQRPRAPSASSSSSSRPTSALAHAPPPRPASVLASVSARPVKPFAPSRSVSESSKPQRQPGESSKPAPTAVSRGFMRPTASSTSAQRSVSSSAVPTTTASTTSSAPSRPPITRPPTATAALLSVSASRRPVAPPESAKGSAAAKVLGGGAKRVLSAQGKAPTAAVLAQAIRKNGFVPKRAAASKLSPDLEEILKEAEEESRASSPAVVGVVPELAEAAVLSPHSEAMQAILEDEQPQPDDAKANDELSIEDLVVVRPVENEDAAPTATEQVTATEQTPVEIIPEVDVLEANKEVASSTSIAEPQIEAAPAVPVPAVQSVVEVDLAKTVRHDPSPVTYHRRHVHHAMPATAEEDAARAARHEEKRRAFEALSAREQDAIRQRKREKRAQRARDREEQERRAQAELERAAAVPLPPDDEKSREPSPVPAPDFAITMEARTESPVDIHVQIAAAVPLPEDADDGLHMEELHVHVPVSPYTVALPIVKMPRSAPQPHVDHESDASSSRSHTPEEVHYVDDMHGPREFEDENIALLPAPVSEKDPIESKDIGEDGKQGRVGAERAFAEVDINALVR